MLMWGDIILRHSDQLARIPKDTIMLTWGYDPRLNFDDQILPFVNDGYQFLVCPGANGWNRVLPAFGAATTNIQNFVRDGVRHGALGMLNTAWDDDGETFNAPNWHAFAWGAECAWNGSTTCADDFNRRLGAVLFGERDAEFGQAVQELSAPGVEGMANRAFWQFGFGAIKVRGIEAGRSQWEKPLAEVRSAILRLERCRAEARHDANLLDYFLFGARRIELSLVRELNRLDAALTYREARRAQMPASLSLLAQVEDRLRGDRDAHQALASEFAVLWRRENKPYALDWTQQRYRDLIQKYNEALERLARARSGAKPDRSLPTPREVGLELIED